MHVWLARSARAHAALSRRPKYLIEEKALINVVDSNGDTPAHDAARFGHVNVLGLVLVLAEGVGATDPVGYVAVSVMI